MTHEASRTDLSDWLTEVGDNDDDLLLMTADLYTNKDGLDVVFDASGDAFEYSRHPFHDVFVGFGKLDPWWTNEACMMGAEFFVVTKIAYAPYDGVCCFRFDCPLDAYQAKILLNMSK